MQICKDHWAKMREKVKEFGMEHLVARTGEEAMAAMVDQINGIRDKAAFDPLMNANWAITGTFLDGFQGDDAIRAMAQPDLCPLCFVEKNHEGRADNWIEGSITDQLNCARHLGLMPKEQ